MKQTFVLTSSVRISQLPADYSGISGVPGVITHCPPLVIDAHLHSTFILIGASHQTNISISTVSTGIYCRKVLHSQSVKYNVIYCALLSNLDISLQHPLSGHANSRD